MEVDISKMRIYNKSPSKNVREIFWIIIQNQLFESTLAEECVNQIVRDCQKFNNEIWTAIRVLRHKAEGKENAYTEHTNWIIDNPHHVKSEDNY
jgi:hypothetical protein